MARLRRTALGYGYAGIPAEDARHAEQFGRRNG